MKCKLYFHQPLNDSATDTCRIPGKKSILLSLKNSSVENFLLAYIFVLVQKEKSKKANLYVGKVQQRYLHDADGPTILLKLDCLKPAVGSTTLLEEIPSHLPRDIGDFEAHNIIAGPLEATPEKGKKWAIKFYPQVHQTFEHVMKLNREEDYNKLFPKTE